MQKIEFHSTGTRTQ